MLTPSMVILLGLCSSALALRCMVSIKAREGSVSKLDVTLGSGLCKDDFTRCAVVRNMPFGEFNQLIGPHDIGVLSNVDNSLIDARFCAPPTDCSAIKAPASTGPCSPSGDACCCEGDNCNG